MSEQGGGFLEACGATGPLRIERDDPATGAPVVVEVRRPAVIVGRNPGADLVLDDPSVGGRHLYLQVIGGRLFAIDLESRGGVRWGEIPRPAGWVERGQPLRLGATTIRVVDGIAGGEGSDEAGTRPAPTTSRYVSREPLPGVILEVRGDEGRRRVLMDRVLMLVGRSERCKLRPDEPGASRFACGLVRTPKALWMVDLLSTRGATVNGARCPAARLEDGDVIGVGRWTFRVYYDGTSAPSGVRASLPPAVANGGGSSRALAALSPVLAGPPALGTAGDLGPETILRPLLELGGAGPEGSSPFGEALVLLVRLLGDIHRDHLGVVQQELAQIRRLNQEIERLRASASSPPPPSAPAPAPAVPPPSATVEPPPPAGDAPRPDPQTVRLVVAERLEAWERERQSHWRKILNLLVPP